MKQLLLAAFAAVAAVAASLVAGPAQGQEGVTRLQVACGGGTATGERYCQELAIRGQAARAAQGILTSGGSEIPGMAGSLGLRIWTVPRVTVGLRGLAARANFTGDLAAGSGDPLPGPPATEEAFNGTAVHLNAGVGVFDGFSPLPTVGGLLAVDIVGAASFVFLPDDRGFDAGGSHFGLGLRLGILRESFTLPGVTLSAVRRWGGEASVSGPFGSTRHDPVVTSYRATVGKDFLGVGLLAGGGLDAYSGPITVLPPSGGDPGPAPAGTGPATADFTDSRSIVFAGASLNYLVVQLSAEAGWAEGLEAPEGRPEQGFDPSASSWFGSLAVRLTY